MHVFVLVAVFKTAVYLFWWWLYFCLFLILSILRAQLGNVHLCNAPFKLFSSQYNNYGFCTNPSCSKGQGLKNTVHSWKVVVAVPLKGLVCFSRFPVDCCEWCLIWSRCDVGVYGSIYVGVPCNKRMSGKWRGCVIRRVLCFVFWIKYFINISFPYPARAACSDDGLGFKFFYEQVGHNGTDRKAHSYYMHQLLIITLEEVCVIEAEMSIMCWCVVWTWMLYCGALCVL